jgi:hypothetical protein
MPLLRTHPLQMDPMPRRAMPKHSPLSSQNWESIRKRHSQYRKAGQHTRRGRQSAHPDMSRYCDKGKRRGGRIENEETDLEKGKRRRGEGGGREVLPVPSN